VVFLVAWLLWRSRFSPGPLVGTPFWLLGPLVCGLGQALRFYVLGLVPEGTSGQGSVIEASTLNTRGPYAYVRNPLYVGNLFIVLGLLLLAQDVWVALVALADFGTVSYFALEVFTTGIFKAWLGMGDRVAAAQLSSCLLGFVVLLLALERVSRGRAAFHATAAAKPVPRQRLRGRHAALATLACALPVVLGFLVPAAILLELAAADPQALWRARLAGLVLNSFTLSGVTAIAAVLLALMMAYAARLSRSRVAQAANRVAALGYAVPGAVIAIGVLVPLAQLDNWFAGILERLTGEPSGLLLTGSIAALVYACLVRFLAVALQTTEAGLARITPSMEDAARSLGASPAQTLARVHAPLVARSLATAALLVFVDVMKELPATFALRPFNFDTLAVEAYHLAKDERLAEAAVPSLVIVLVGLVPLLLLSRRYFQATRS
jgi:iron(III) transport system permease protein